MVHLKQYAGGGVVPRETRSDQIASIVEAWVKITGRCGPWLVGTWRCELCSAQRVDVIPIGTEAVISDQRWRCEKCGQRTLAILDQNGV